MWRLAAALLVLSTVAAMAAEPAVVVSPGPDRVSVAVYHEGDVATQDLVQRFGGGGGGLALVSETRTVTLPAGPVEIRFRGVASTMAPQTAHLDGLLPRAGNFNFDLLSPATLIAKSIGKTVTLVRTDRDTGTVREENAVLESGPNGVVLKLGDHVEALNCAGGPERLVFNALPEGLYDTPTLSVAADVPRAARYTLTLRYLAAGLNWSADYVARLDPGGRTLSLNGWVTLANFSDTGFKRAPVEVIAGRPATTGQDHAPFVRPQLRNDACWPTAIDWISRAQRIAARLSRAVASPAPPVGSNLVETVTVAGTSIRPRDLGDMKLYPLPAPTDLNARQTKQVQFLTAAAVPFRRVYRVTAADPQAYRLPQTEPAAIRLKLENSKQGGLGVPLPAGGVAVMAPDAGAPMLLGEDKMDDVAEGLPLDIASGSTMAVG
jgi:hypothetical protein